MNIKGIVLIQLIIVLLAGLVNAMTIKAFVIMLMMCIEMVFLCGMIWGKEWK